MNVYFSALHSGNAFRLLMLRQAASFSPRLFSHQGNNHLSLLILPSATTISSKRPQGSINTSLFHHHSQAVAKYQNHASEVHLNARIRQIADTLEEADLLRAYVGHGNTYKAANEEEKDERVMYSGLSSKLGSGNNFSNNNNNENKNDDEDFSNSPMIFLLGNHSSGKSSFINYLLQRNIQDTGVAPTDDGFTVIMASDEGDSHCDKNDEEGSSDDIAKGAKISPRKTAEQNTSSEPLSFSTNVGKGFNLDEDGPTALANPRYGFQELSRLVNRNFMRTFKVKTRVLPSHSFFPKRMLIVDSPGMMDTPVPLSATSESSDGNSNFIMSSSVHRSRRGLEGGGRGYDFISVVQWFARRADLIILFLEPFSPGTTGETLDVLMALMNRTDSLSNVAEMMNEGNLICGRSGSAGTLTATGINGGIGASVTIDSVAGNYFQSRDAFPKPLIEHKLLIVMNKVDVFENISDYVRAYGTVCWNLGKIIRSKDVPKIYNNYTPTYMNGVGKNELISREMAKDLLMQQMGKRDDDSLRGKEAIFYEKIKDAKNENANLSSQFMAVADSSSLGGGQHWPRCAVPIEDLEKGRLELLDEIMKTPLRRLDNNLTDMTENAKRILMTAKSINFIKRKLKQKKLLLGVVASTLSISAPLAFILGTGITSVTSMVTLPFIATSVPSILVALSLTAAVGIFSKSFIYEKKLQRYTNDFLFRYLICNNGILKTINIAEGNSGVWGRTLTASDIYSANSAASRRASVHNNISDNVTERWLGVVKGVIIDNIIENAVCANQSSSGALSYASRRRMMGMLGPKLGAYHEDGCESSLQDKGLQYSSPSGRKVIGFFQRLGLSIFDAVVGGRIVVLDGKAVISVRDLINGIEELPLFPSSTVAKLNKITGQTIKKLRKEVFQHKQAILRST